MDRISGARELPWRLDFCRGCAVKLPFSCSSFGLPYTCPTTASLCNTTAHGAEDSGLEQFVTKRRSSWACTGNPNPEQETIKGTHAQETSAYQRRPTTQHAAQGLEQLQSHTVSPSSCLQGVVSLNSTNCSHSLCFTRCPYIALRLLCRKS